MESTTTRIPEPPGTLVLDRYRLAGRLGSGGFGVVWAARDERLGRDVAVKLVPINADAPARAGQRARREALAAARLGHPGIVALYEAGRDRDHYVLVSELVRGRTLAALLGEGALSDRDVLRIGALLADALTHAHARGVIHRDVKPSNVLCPESLTGAGGLAKLTDFGVAHMTSDEALTQTGDVVGTLAYMAPEQAAGHPAGPGADTWALAIVLYEGLAGVNPVGAENAAAIARNLSRPVPPLGRVRRDLPRELTEAIDAALTRDPADRVSLAELREELAAAVPHADDTPGVIDGPGLQETARAGDRPADAGRDRREARRHEDSRADGVAPPRLASPWVEPRRRPTGPLARIVAALAMGALVAALLAGLGPASPVAPFPAAVAAGAVVFLLPRLGWLAAATILVAWAGAALPGAALVLALAAAPVPLLLPLAGSWWSAPVLAPALGAVGVAAAFPAAAGQARTPIRRAALGALGAWWLALAEALTGERLLLGPPAGLPPRGAWELSAFDTATTVLPSLATVELAALGGLFALAAAILPALVRGRAAVIDLLAAGAWAAALAAVIAALSPQVSPPGLVVGAVLGAAFAVAARAVAGRR
ncbi:MAG TPA: serine/threonine-protein kinase [Solirubrobacteraceae bacterium]|nr:serine/threonine-protein kinase [Solirubrobacteraceae bacterium]